MAITLGASTTAQQANVTALNVAVPTGAANGDRLYALCCYANDVETLTLAGSGWTEIASGVGFSTMRFSLAWRTMATGVTNCQWTVSAAAGFKAAMSMVVVKGASGHTLGTVLNRSVTATTSVLPSVTVPSGGLLLAFAVDRVSSQSSVTAPSPMVEQAKNMYGGGGGVTNLIASEFPSAGASGTRTITYGVTSANAAGLLVAFTPSSGTPPTVGVPADAMIESGTTKTLAGTDSGAVSRVWTQTSGPASPTITNPTSVSGATVTPTIAGTYIFRLTSTNADGSTFDEFTLTVTEATVEASSVIVNPGGFTPVVAASLEVAVSDAADTTWAESAAAAASITFKLQPVSARPTYTVRTRMRMSTGTASVLVELMQGTVVIADATHSITATLATYSFVLTAGEAANITDRAGLRQRITRL